MTLWALIWIKEVGIADAGEDKGIPPLSSDNEDEDTADSDDWSDWTSEDAGYDCSWMKRN